MKEFKVPFPFEQPVLTYSSCDLRFGQISKKTVSTQQSEEDFRGAWLAKETAGAVMCPVCIQSDKEIKVER